MNMTMEQSRAQVEDRLKQVQQGLESILYNEQRTMATNIPHVRMTLLDVTPEILRRAAHPFPEPVGTLDAIHLTTAVRYRDTHRLAPSFATHDRELAIAARALGFAVIGTPIS